MKRVPPATVAGLVALALATTAAQRRPAEHWVGTWATAVVSSVAPAPAPQFANAAAPVASTLTFSRQTLREIVHVSIGAALVRVVLTDAFGTAPLQVGSARIGVRAKDAAIIEGSSRLVAAIVRVQADAIDLRLFRSQRR